MDLSLTEQQRMLQATARELVVRDYNRETLVAIDAGRQSSGPHWAGLVSTGLLGVLVPEEYGGAGGSLADAAVAYEELGQGPVPGPHFSSGILAALVVLEGGTDEQCSCTAACHRERRAGVRRCRHGARLRVGARTGAGDLPP